MTIPIPLTVTVFVIVQSNTGSGIETVIEGDILKKGVIAIDAKIFSEIVRKLPDNEVVIETDANLQTTITCEKAKFNISAKSLAIFSLSLI